MHSVVDVPTSLFSYTATPGVDSAAFASALCAALETSASGSSTLGTLSISGGDTVLELPDCLWAEYGLYSSTLKYATLTNVVVRGNITGTSGTTGPSATSPLMRLSSSIKSLSLRGCTFVDPTTTTYAPSWQAFVDRMPVLDYLLVAECTIGGSIFTTLPVQLTTAIIYNSGLTGSISDSLLSVVNTQTSFLNIVLTFNKLSGSIPGALFANFANGNSFSEGSIDLSGNQLTGTIPAGLLSSDNMPHYSFSLSLANNSLSGSLPSSMCASCSSYLSLDVSMNQLSGTISPSLFDHWFARGPVGLQFSASNNSFTGAVPSLFANVPETNLKKKSSLAIAYIASTRLDFSYNKFSSAGLNVVANTSTYVQNSQYLNLSFNEITSLADHFLDSYTGALTVDLTSNKLTTLPAAFLHGMVNYYTATVLLGQNLLTSLPDGLFNSSLKFEGLIFNVSKNPTLTGSLPSGLTSLAASSISGYDLDFSHCGFTGAIPNMPFSNEVDNIRLSFASNRLNNGSSGLHLSSFIAPTNIDGIYGLELDISDNAFEGALDITGLSSLMRDTLTDSGFYLNASGNSFTALAYDDNWASATFSLDISRNTLLTSANFPESLFNASSVIETLYASKTGIVGVFPILTNEDFLQLYELDFSGSSGIDFCSGNRTAWTTGSLNVCKLYLTTAANCSDLYPSYCEFSAPPEAPVSPPVEVPSASPSVAPGTPTAPATPETPSVAPNTPSATPATPGTPSATPTRSPTGAANAASASLIVIAFAALVSLVASV